MNKFYFSLLASLMLFTTAWSQQDSIFIDITIRDFASNHPDFENFNSKVAAPTLADCGYEFQPELADAAVKQSYFDQLRADFPTHYQWATPSSRDIFPTFGMVNTTLNSDGVPTKARSACNNDFFEQWFTDVTLSLIHI